MSKTNNVFIFVVVFLSIATLYGMKPSSYYDTVNTHRITPLQFFVQGKNVRGFFEAYQHLKPDINEQELFSGQTALHYAVIRDCLPLVLLILRLGANAAIQNYHGQMASDFKFKDDSGQLCTCVHFFKLPKNNLIKAIGMVDPSSWEVGSASLKIRTYANT